MFQKTMSTIKMNAYFNLHNRLRGGSIVLQELGVDYLYEAPLPYPTRETRGPVEERITEYIIPDEDKEKVLEELFPFVNIPSMNDVLWDLHEKKTFTVKDFKVIRECDLNLLVSPWFNHTGGSVIDWAVDPPEDDCPPHIPSQEF